MIDFSREKTCCFTGHREVSIHDDEISSRLLCAINDMIRRGYNCFAVGGAVGFDMLAAIILASLKKKGADIGIVFALPCYGYSKKWSDEQRAIQSVLLEQADLVIMVTASGYTRGCMHKRNKYLIEHSSACICYLDRETGGTAYTVREAKKQGLEVINICN